MKKALICLMLMGSLIAQDLSNRSQQPKPKVPFRLTYEHIPDIFLRYHEIKGNILVQFIIDENGKVIEPQILDTFNLSLNPTIIDRVMAIEFEPALQNGRPIKVRYNLPIVFK